MGIQIYPFIATQLQTSSTDETQQTSAATEAAQTTDSATTAASDATSSAVTFEQTLALAEEAYEKSKEVDATLAQNLLETLGTSGNAASSRIAYELGFTGSVTASSDSSASSTADSTAATDEASEISDDSEASASITLEQSENYTTKCPSHTGTDGTDNSGILECPDEYQAYFEAAAEATGVDVKLLKSVALAESSFDADEVSSTGAVGIMQIMPETQEDYGIEDAYDPLENILGGARILADKLEEFDGNLSKALAAYNAGSGTVNRLGGVPDYCWNYVAKITGYYNS